MKREPVAQASGCGKGSLFCHSERREESLFDLSPRKEREIPRFARNDKMLEGLFSQPVKPALSDSNNANFEDLKA